MRIICEQTHGQWVCWFEQRPMNSYGHRDVAQALIRLLEATPGMETASITADDEPPTGNRMTFLVQADDRIECPDCRGTGEYVGLQKIESCTTCSGSGWIDG